MEFFESPEIESIDLDPLWFNHLSKVHSLNHTYRVMFWCKHLGSKLSDPKSYPTKYYHVPIIDSEMIAQATKLAFLGAIIHDTVRHDDCEDPSHGKRAADNSLWILDELGFDLDLEETTIIQSIVTQHSLPDTDLIWDVEGIALMILKDADGLDRIRIGDLIINYLRLPWSKNQVAYSAMLIGLTEENSCANFQEMLEIGQRVFDELK